MSAVKESYNLSELARGEGGAYVAFCLTNCGFGRGKSVKSIAGRWHVHGVVTEGNALVNNVLVKLKLESSKKSADNTKQGSKVTQCSTKRSAK